MSSLNRFSILILLSLAAVSAIFFCSPLPQDPRDSSNTSVSLIIKDANGKISLNSYADTVNKKFFMGSALKLPENLDSLKLTLKFGDSAIFDTTFFSTSLGLSYQDTIWVERTLFAPGLYSATITPYSTLGLLPVSANIMLVEAAVMPENHKPVITVTGNTIFKPGETCRLTVSTSDADVNQILTAATMGKPAGSEFVNKIFTWAIPSSFTGLDTISFIVMDNGYPVQSDTETVVITVTSTPHIPMISISGDSIIQALKPCTLSIATSDEDAGQILLVNMSGNPANSVITENSTFIWTPAAADTGIHQVMFTVTDNGIPPLSNSILINLHVKSSDSLISHLNSAPEWSVDTLTYSMGSASQYSLNLPDMCNDADTDQITYTLLHGSPEGDTILTDIYSITATEAIAGTHFVNISAEDPNGAKDILVIKLIIENSAVDTTGPQITFITPENGTAKTNDSSYTIDMICSDASGIASVTAEFGEKQFTATLSNGHYTIAITGLLPDEENKITITATDSSPLKKAASKVALISYMPLHTVTYDANTATGDAPADTGKYEYKANVTVAAKGALSKTGYTFTGWNTVANGSGALYAAGTLLTMGKADIILYAQWTNNPTFTVTYDANTGTGETPVDENKYEADAVVTVAGPSTLVKAGFAFTGWNTAADGSGTARAAATTFNMPSANVTLYAQWKVKQYSVTYDANGASTGNVPSDANKYDTGTSVTVSDNTGNLVKTGHNFGGWNTEVDGTGTNYEAGSGSFAISKDTKLFAKWTIKKYNVTYNGNENTGGNVPDEVSYDSNTTVTVSGNINGLTKTGFDFNGWNTKANGSGVAMAANAKFTIKSDTTLYAQWTVKKYKLTIVPPVNGTVNLSGDVSVDSGATTNITASAASGFKFKCWRVISGSAQITDTLSASTAVKLTQGNASIKAVFGGFTFNKTIGFSEYEYSASNFSVAQGNDGNFYVAYTVTNSSLVRIAAVLKLDLNGNTVWKQEYSNGTQDADVYSIRKTSDGCLLLSGAYNYYMTLWKIASNKNQIFCASSGDEGTFGKIAFETSDGGFVIGGSKNGNGAYAKKTKSNAYDLTWEMLYDGNTTLNDGQETTDGGCIFVGDDYGFNVTKTDANGVTKWKKTFAEYSGGSSIRQTTDGGYIVGGQGGSYGQPHSSGLIKISADGSTEWQKTNDFGSGIVSVRQTADGGYAYTGFTEKLGAGGSDIYLVKTNSSGEITWSKTFGTEESEYVRDMELCNDGGFIIVGDTNDGKCMVIKTDENGNVE